MQGAIAKQLTEQQCLPDYNGASIVNLMSSIQHVLGLPYSTYEQLNQVDLTTICDGRNIVLFVVDGLGYHQVDTLDDCFALKSMLAARLTSVFPSTTASAITSLLTGQAPQQHGLVGWFMHAIEAGEVIAPLPFQSRRSPADNLPVSPAALFTSTRAICPDRVHEQIIYPQAIANSQYSNHFAGGRDIHAYDTLETMSQIVIDRLADPDAGRQFLYVYFSQVDTMAHQFGSGSDIVLETICAFDTQLKRIIDAPAARTANLLVTADHGFVDPTASECLSLEQFPELAATLSQPLCGEPRAIFCHIKDDHKIAFEDAFNETFSEYADLYPSKQVIEEGLFGLGQMHPDLSHRTGDFTLLMKNNYLLKDWLPNERPFTLRGVHGGISRQEMSVPLCIATP